MCESKGKNDDPDKSSEARSFINSVAERDNQWFTDTFCEGMYPTDLSRGHTAQQKTFLKKAMKVLNIADKDQENQSLSHNSNKSSDQKTQNISVTSENSKRSSGSMNTEEFQSNENSTDAELFMHEGDDRWFKETFLLQEVSPTDLSKTHAAQQKGFMRKTKDVLDIEFQNKSPGGTSSKTDGDLMQSLSVNYENDRTSNVIYHERVDTKKESSSAKCDITKDVSNDTSVKSNLKESNEEKLKDVDLPASSARQDGGIKKQARQLTVDDFVKDFELFPEVYPFQLDFDPDHDFLFETLVQDIEWYSKNFIYEEAQMNDFISLLFTTAQCDRVKLKFSKRILETLLGHQHEDLYTELEDADATLSNDTNFNQKLFKIEEKALTISTQRSEESLAKTERSFLHEYLDQEAPLAYSEIPESKKIDSLRTPNFKNKLKVPRAVMLKNTEIMDLSSSYSSTYEKVGDNYSSAKNMTSGFDHEYMPEKMEYIHDKTTTSDRYSSKVKENRNHQLSTCKEDDHTDTRENLRRLNEPLCVTPTSTIGTAQHYMSRATENTRYNLGVDKMRYVLLGAKGLEDRDYLILGRGEELTEISIYTDPDQTTSGISLPAVLFATAFIV